MGGSIYRIAEKQLIVSLFLPVIISFGLLLGFTQFISTSCHAQPISADATTIEGLWAAGETKFNEKDYNAALVYFQTIKSNRDAYTKTIPDDNAYPYADVANLKIMRCYEELKNHAQVEKAYTAFINEFPNSPVRPAVEYTMAHSLQFNEKQYREALERYAMITTKYPESHSVPASKLRIAELYLDFIPSERGYFDYWLALDLFQEVVDKYPNTVHGAQALFAVAYTNHMISRIPQARKAAQQLVDNYSAFKNQYEHGLYTLAFLDYREGKWDLALKEFSTFIENNPSSKIAPDALKQMARIYYFQGNYKQAIIATERIMANYPDSSLAAEARIQAQRLYQKSGLTFASSTSNLPAIGKSTTVKEPVVTNNTPSNKLLTQLCGPSALKSVCDYYHIPAEVAELANIAKTDESGTNLYGLLSAATSKGFKAYALKLKYSQLPQIPLPAIVHINQNHFIVLRDINKQYIAYLDGEQKLQQMSMTDFRKVWNGTILVLSPKQPKINKSILVSSIPNIGIYLTKSEMLLIQGGNTPTENVFFCPNVNGNPPCGGAGGFGGGIGFGGRNGSRTHSTKTPNRESNEPAGGGAVASIGGGSGNSATSLGINLGNKYTYTIFPEMEIPCIPGGGSIVVKRIFVSPRYPDTFGDNNPYGNKWTINYNTHLIVPQEGQTEIAWLNEYGDQYRFIPENNYYVPDNVNHHYGLYAKLIKQTSTNEWVLEFKTGTKFYFPTSEDSNYSSWLSKVVDRNGNIITVARDSNCNIIKNVHDSLNRQITFLYDTYNHLTALIDPTSTKIVSYIYSNDSDLIQITDPDGYSIYYNYNTNHQITTIRDSFSGTTTLYQYFYDYNSTVGYSICTEIVDVYGRITKFENTWWGIDSVSLYETSTSVLLRGCEYQFTSDNYNVTGIKYSDGETMTVNHDTYGNITSIVTRNNQTSYTYYNTFGNVTASTDVSGNTSYYYFDDTYNVITCSVNPLGNRTYYGYDTCRNLLWIKDPNGTQNSLAYDTYGNRTSSTDALNRSIRYFYDQYSQLTTVISPSNETSRFYYNTYGNYTCVVNPLGEATYYNYDTMRRLTSVSDALNGITQYEYYVNGLLKRITNANNHQINYTYDFRNRLITETDAGNNSYHYYYDRFDNVTTRQDGKGQYTDYYYDSLSQLTTKIYRDGGQTVRFYYDILGNMTTMNDPNIGMVYWYYDTLSRMTAQVCGLGTNWYTYDAAGRKTSMTDPDGNAILYYYDAAGHVYLVQNGFNQFTQYGLNELGLKTQEWYENSVFTDYTYDNNNRLTQIKVWRPTDDFNRPDSTNIGSRWQERVSDWSIQSTQLHIQCTDTIGLVIDTAAGNQTGGASVDICFTMHNDADKKNAFIVFGYSSDTDFCYAGAWSNRWAIGRYQSGTWNDYTTSSKTFTYNRPYRMKLEFPNPGKGDDIYSLYYYSSNGWIKKISYEIPSADSKKVGLAATAIPGSAGYTVHAHFDNYLLNGMTLTTTFGAYTAYTYTTTYNSITTYTYSTTYNYNTTYSPITETYISSTSYTTSTTYTCSTTYLISTSNNFTDDFNRSDSTNLGESWAELYGNWSVLNNQADISANNCAIAEYEDPCFEEVSLAASVKCVSDNTTKQNGLLMFFDGDDNICSGGIDVSNQLWLLGISIDKGANWSYATSISDTTLSADTAYMIRVDARTEWDEQYTLYIYASLSLFDGGQWVTKIPEILVDQIGGAAGGYLNVGLLTNGGHTRFDNFSINQNLAIDTVVSNQTTITVQTTITTSTTKMFTDDFNRADSTNLGTGWTETYGDWSVSNNQADIISPGTESIAQYTGNYYSQITIAADIICKSDYGMCGYLLDGDYYAGIDIDGLTWRLGKYLGEKDGLNDVAYVSDTSLTVDSTYRVRLYARTEYGPSSATTYGTVYLWDKGTGQWVTKINETLIEGVETAGENWCHHGGLLASWSHTRYDNFSINQNLAVDTVVTITTTVTVQTTITTQTTVSVQTSVTSLSYPAQFDYTYDKNGNRTKVVDLSNNTTNYLYDTLNQLTTEQRLGSTPYKYTYWYDSVGNRTTMIYNNTTTHYTYNNLNQLTYRYLNSTMYHYSYDENGNCTEWYRDAGFETKYLTYDRENRMTAWSVYPIDVNYTYCALGKRVMKAYNNNTTLYFYDGINTILEKYKASTSSNFSTSAVYTLAPGVISHIISERKNNTDLYFHYDPIGNVQFITNSYGQITASYVQEGFGNILASIGSLTTENWHLTTKQIEPEIGLYFFYARWYDPEVGRFITWDPEIINIGLSKGCIKKTKKLLREPLGLNPYLYTINNPITLIDPNGLDFWDWFDWEDLLDLLEKGWDAWQCREELCELLNTGDQCNLQCTDPEIGGRDNKCWWDCIKGQLQETIQECGTLALTVGL